MRKQNLEYAFIEGNEKSALVIYSEEAFLASFAFFAGISIDDDGHAFMDICVGKRHLTLSCADTAEVDRLVSRASRHAASLLRISPVDNVIYEAIPLGNRKTDYFNLDAE